MHRTASTPHTLSQLSSAAARREAPHDILCLIRQGIRKSIYGKTAHRNKRAVFLFALAPDGVIITREHFGEVRYYC